MQNQPRGLRDLVLAFLVGEELFLERRGFEEVRDALRNGLNALKARGAWGCLTALAGLVGALWFLWLVADTAAAGLTAIVLLLTSLWLIWRLPRVFGGVRRRIDRSRWPQARMSIDRAVGVLFPAGGYNPSDDAQRKRVEELAKKMPGTDPLIEAAIRALVAQGYPVHPVD